MSGDAIGALATSVALLALLTWGMWPTHDRRLFRWSARFGVVISRAGREQVIRDLERSKRLRWGAAVLGLGISALPTYVNLVSPNDAGRFAGEGYGLVWVAAPHSARWLPSSSSTSTHANVERSSRRDAGATSSRPDL